MTTIKYTITFLSEWHIGSGLGAGAELDATVLKDKDGLPYVPGKSIKGLIRQAADEISSMPHQKINNQTIIEIFGQKADDKETESTKANSFFSNALMLDDEKEEIIKNQLQDYLYKTFARTKIDDNGIAVDHSLRTIEVCVPIQLEGSIEIEEKHEKAIIMTLKWVRAMGVNRNRGLGKCKIEIK
jgi:CRISPR/Cas system CSM-associated protein Csm3 (group 7 of RAMP superfamily)